MVLLLCWIVLAGAGAGAGAVCSILWTGGGPTSKVHVQYTVDGSEFPTSKVHVQYTVDGSDFCSSGWFTSGVFGVDMSLFRRDSVEESVTRGRTYTNISFPAHPRPEEHFVMFFRTRMSV